MFQETSPQRSLFGVENQLNPEKRKRLENSWAEGFRTRALPLVDERQFAKYFCEDNGRPNKSVRLVVSVLLLKEVNNLTDAEALEHLEWNLSWHYALCITPEEAHTCQKTLHNFRQKLIEDDQGAGWFEAMCARLIEAAGIKTGRQRQDSTHILSNIKVLTRLGLFVATITQFLEALRKTYPEWCKEVAKVVQERYLDREGYFSDARGSEAPRRLEQAALDLYRLVTQWGGHEAVSKMEAFATLERLYTEQCVVPETEEPERIELVEKPSSASLQSPSDPDVTYGHKGKGYEVQVVETCHEDNPFQVVTATDVHGANESDQHHLVDMLEQTERTCGEAPEELSADSGYASGENIVEAQAHGTQLFAPIGQKESDKSVTPSDFEFDESGERVLACPTGEAPIDHRPSRGGKATLAVFDGSVCDTCPLRELCPTQKRRDHERVLPFTRADVATARRRVEQGTAEFKERYKIRSGIEATNSELKRRHGLGKLRVRRRKRVVLSVRLKVMALNIKRYMAHLAPKPASPIPMPAAVAC